MACRDGCGCSQEARDARTDEWVGAGMPPSTSTAGPVARLQAEKPAEVQTPDGRSEAVSRCGYQIIDRDGDEAPCDEPATGWRWYQDVGEHEDLLAVACEFHRNEGWDRMHAAEAERDALAAKVARVERLADEMSRRYAAANRPTRIIDAGQAADYAQGAADTWQLAEIDLRAALADPDGGDQ